MDRPQALTEAAVPQYRFWGSRKPPENKADFFNVTVRAATDDQTSGGSGTSGSGSVATIRIYGPIDSWGGWWGVSAEEVAEALDALDPSVTEIRVRLNSPGGEVFEGLAILNMLRAHHARVVAVVDGLAASAAGFLAAGCDETVMSPGTQMMIHDARTAVYGPPETMRRVAAVLDSISTSAAELLSEVAGETTEAWRDLMVAETWYTAREAVAAGLAQRVAVVPDAGPTQTAGDTTPDDDPDEDVEAAFDLSIYAHAGRSHAPDPLVATAATPQPPTASADGSITTQEGSSAVAFTAEQLTTMRQELGLPEDADEATIVAALSEALRERAEDPAPTTASGSVQAGMRLVPDVAWQELQAQAQAGAQAAEQLRVQAREQFLDEHRDRFLPANRDAYRAQYDANPQGTREYLAAAPVLVPLEEVGHDVQQSTTAQDDGWFPQFTTPTAKEA